MSGGDPWDDLGGFRPAVPREDEHTDTDALGARSDPDEVTLVEAEAMQLFAAMDLAKDDITETDPRPQRDEPTETAAPLSPAAAPRRSWRPLVLIVLGVVGFGWTIVVFAAGLALGLVFPR